MVLEGASRDFTVVEDYRGINANMHSVEALLAAADALERLGDAASVAAAERWRSRAGRVLERAVHGFARSADWRLPEHFDSDWQPLPEYNTDDRAHMFRPYGVTPGHLLEWARLALHLRAAELTGAAGTAPGRPWLLDDARALYERALSDGWAADGADGFVYTTAHDGSVSVPARMHWVLTEAIGAAAALFQATGEQRYADDHSRWWEHARVVFIDEVGGSWHSEVDPAGAPAQGTWAGKPDVYHSLQASLVPRLPLAPTFAVALAEAAQGQGRLDP